MVLAADGRCGPLGGPCLAILESTEGFRQVMERHEARIVVRPDPLFLAACVMKS